MEIKYATKDNSTILFNLEEGTIFRPSNSQAVLIKTNANAMDDYFNDLEDNITELWENMQNHDLKTCSELVACVHLSGGEFVFLHEDLKVIKLSGELIVEECE
jgi:hypothetical protein